MQSQNRHKPQTPTSQPQSALEKKHVCLHPVELLISHRHPVLVQTTIQYISFITNSFVTILLSSPPQFLQFIKFLLLHFNQRPVTLFLSYYHLQLLVVFSTVLCLTLFSHSSLLPILLLPILDLDRCGSVRGRCKLLALGWSMKQNKTYGINTTSFVG